MFHHHRLDPKFTPVPRNSQWTVYWNPQWNSYIGNIAKDAGKMFDSCTTPEISWLFLLFSMFICVRLDKNWILLPYLCWSCQIFIVQRVQKRLFSTLQSFSNRRYFKFIYSDIIFIPDGTEKFPVLSKKYWYLVKFGQFGRAENLSAAPSFISIVFIYTDIIFTVYILCGFHIYALSNIKASI